VAEEETNTVVEEETKEGNLLTSTETLVEWVSKMKRTYKLQEATIMDLFRIQLMWVEQASHQPRPTGQEMVDAIGEEQRLKREANEVITPDE
jgi:predicted nucleic-acid-binding protein